MAKTGAKRRVGIDALRAIAGADLTALGAAPPDPVDTLRAVVDADLTTLGGRAAAAVPPRYSEADMRARRRFGRAAFEPEPTTSTVARLFAQPTAVAAAPGRVPRLETPRPRAPEIDEAAPRPLRGGVAEMLAARYGIEERGGAGLLGAERDWRSRAEAPAITVEDFRPAVDAAPATLAALEAPHDATTARPRSEAARERNLMGAIEDLVAEANERRATEAPTLEGSVRRVSRDWAAAVPAAARGVADLAALPFEVATAPLAPGESRVEHVAGAAGDAARASLAGLGAFGFSTAAGLGGLTEAAAELSGFDDSRVARVGRRLRDEAARIHEGIYHDPALQSDVARLFAGGAESIAAMAIAMLPAARGTRALTAAADRSILGALARGGSARAAVRAAAFVPNEANASLALMALPIWGQKYGEMRSAGARPGVAATFATGYALAETLPEKLPMDMIFRRGRRGLRAYVGAALSEVPSEQLTELTNIALDRGYLRPDMRIDEVRTRLRDAAKMAVLIGGGMAATGALVNRGEEDGDAAPGSELPAPGGTAAPRFSIAPTQRFTNQERVIVPQGGARINTEHPDWIAGKSRRDLGAALRSADRIWSDEDTIRLGRQLEGTPRERLVFISQPTTTGQNVHPLALATKLARMFGVEAVDGNNLADPSIEQPAKEVPKNERVFVNRSYRVSRDSGSSWEQLRGARVVVTEDILTTGGSVGAFIRLLRSHGADVVTVAALRGDPKINITTPTRHRLASALRQIGAGIKVDSLAQVLTNGEAESIISLIGETHGRLRRQQLAERIRGIPGRRTVGIASTPDDGQGSSIDAAGPGSGGRGDESQVQAPADSSNRNRLPESVQSQRTSHVEAVDRHNVDSLRAELDAALGRRTVARLERGNRLVIHESEATLPPGRPIGDGVVYGVWDGRAAHLVASNIERGGAAAILKHEGVHAALDAFRGTPTHAALMRRLESLRGDATAGRGSQWFAAALERVPGATPEALTTEEFGAYAVEAYERDRAALPGRVRRWVRDMLAAMRAWAIDRLGWVPHNITEADLAAVAMRALRRGGGGAAAAARYSMGGAGEFRTPEAIEREYRARLNTARYSDDPARWSYEIGAANAWRRERLREIGIDEDAAAAPMKPSEERAARAAAPTSTGPSSVVRDMTTEPPRVVSGADLNAAATGRFDREFIAAATDQSAPGAAPTVIAPAAGRGGLRPPVIDFTRWRDRPAFLLARETMERNIQDVAPRGDAARIDAFLTRPVEENETARVRFVNELRAEIRDEMRRLGIRAGSREDALVMEYGEGNLDDTALAAATRRADAVRAAAAYFRAKYDELLDRVNAARAAFNYAPIPKLENYFRHFQFIGSAIQQFGVFLNMEDLPTSISGMTEFFRPGKPFSSAELKRLGIDTTMSAIRGMDNYLDAISRQMFHIDSLQRARALEAYIRDSAEAADAARREGRGGVEALLEGAPREVKLANFVSNLREYGNLLSGKKHTIDRGIESTFGRKPYMIFNFLRARTAANMVGGNVASAVMNFLPFAQSLATTNKIAAARGLYEALAAPLVADPARVDGVESGFLVRRFPDAAIDPTPLARAEGAAGWLFAAIDRFVSRAVVAGKYYEGVAAGLAPDRAMRVADRYAKRVITDRSIGQLPNLFGSRALAPITQFQIEVNNLVSFITKDVPRMNRGARRAALRTAAAYAQLFLYSFLANEGYERLLGRRPTIDPVYAVLTALGLAGDDDDERELGERVRAAAVDLADNLPFTGLAGGRFPVTAGLPSNLPGDAGWEREWLIDPAAFYLAPLAGLQAKKAVEGAVDYGRGYAETRGGRVMYPIEQDAPNLVRALFLGRYALPEARAYRGRGARPLGERQGEELKALPPDERAARYEEIMAARRERREGGAAAPRW